MYIWSSYVHLSEEFSRIETYDAKEINVERRADLVSVRLKK